MLVFKHSFYMYGLVTRDCNTEWNFTVLVLPVLPFRSIKGIPNSCVDSYWRLLTEVSVNKSDPLFWWMKDTFVHQVLTFIIIRTNVPFFSGMSLWHSARTSLMILFKQESTTWFRINAAHLFTPWVFECLCNNFHAVKRTFYNVVKWASKETFSSDEWCSKILKELGMERVYASATLDFPAISSSSSNGVVILEVGKVGKNKRQQCIKKRYYVFLKHPSLKFPWQIQ